MLTAMSDQSRGQGWWLASDGKWYPPAPPSPAAAPAAQWQAPPSGMNGCLKAFLVVGGLAVVGFLALVVVGLFAADDAADHARGKQATIDDDVEVTSCEPDGLGFMAAQLRVVNDSEDRSNYDITVVFTSPDGSEQLKTDSAQVSSLESGQLARPEARTFQRPPAGGYDCKVLHVVRLSDET